MPPQRDWLDKDFYEILGVAPTSTPADVKRAYRKLAQELHPDANRDDPQAEERFKAVSEAYAVLGNEEKRKEYDQLRRLAATGAFTGGFGGGRGGFTSTDGDLGDLNDLFGNLFGGGTRGGFGRGGARRPRKGADLEANVHLSFEDALRGVTTTLRVVGDGPCATCHGTGAAPGTSPRVCPVCNGRGTTASNQGMFSFAQPCANCGATGHVVDTPCATCAGTGRQVRPRELTVNVPAGVRDGAVIRLGGRGGPGVSGGEAGDVLVRVRVEPHRLFGRRGDDITVEVPITFAEAALGTKLTVPLPHASGSRGVGRDENDTTPTTTTIKIPAGTASGRTFRVRGRGAPKRKGGRGDLHVTVTVDVPDKLSKRQKQLLEQLAQLDDTSARERLLASAGRGEAP